MPALKHGIKIFCNISFFMKISFIRPNEFILIYVNFSRKLIFKDFFYFFSYFTCMNNTKVYQLIQVLPLSDRAKISAFLNSEPAGKTTLISSLYDFICIHLHSSEENLPREKVWNSLYPGQPFRDSTLRKLCADLAKN